MRRRMVAVMLSALLGACASPGERPVQAPAPVASFLPVHEYVRLAEQGQRVMQIDPAYSLVVIEVRRAGSLAEFGHDHVAASHAVEGFIAPNLGRADVALGLETLEVDDPVLRGEAGMESQPSPADIRGTRGNMLGPVLEADRYPVAVIALRGAPLQAGESHLAVLLTLHGVTRPVDVPVRIEVHDEDATVTGRFAIDQTSFGIVPFELLGGAIAVQNRIEIRFRLAASDSRRR